MKNKKELNEKVPVRKKGLYEKYVKRPLDFGGALLEFVVLSPVMLITAFLVLLNLGTPVLFKQKRPGLNGQVFNIYKFRTMTDEKDENGELLPDTERLTKFGRFLRSTSLDELPEAINIVKGEMSLVRDSEIVGTTKKNLDFSRFQRLELNPVMRFLCRNFRLTAEILNIGNGILDAHLTQTKEQRNLIRRCNQAHDENIKFLHGLFVVLERCM